MANATPLPLYVIGLGSNRRHVRYGDPRRVLMAALEALEADDIEAVDASPIITSSPIGPSRRLYANAVALVASSLSPDVMFSRLQQIESTFGRRNGQRWSARTLDLDLLLWSGGVWCDAAITIPHPALAERAFVLGPMSLIVPGWRHPLLARTTRQLAARLERPKPVDRRRHSL